MLSLSCLSLLYKCCIVLQCVAECCKSRIAMYSCNPMHMHARYQKYCCVMQCGAGCCTNVMWCIKVFCTRRTATYSCNSTHMHACYPKPPHHNPPVFLGFFLLERVCGGMCVRRDGFSCTPTPGHLQLKLWCCAFLCSLPRKGGRVHRNAQHNNFSRKRPRVGVPQALYGVHMCMYVCGCVGVGGCGCVWVCVYGCVWVREGWGEGGLEGLSQA